jgi:hypothetical protein
MPAFCRTVFPGARSFFPENLSTFCAANHRMLSEFVVPNHPTQRLFHAEESPARDNQTLIPLSQEGEFQGIEHTR